MAVIIIVCATTAYNFGTKIFYSTGVEAKPGTDMTVTIKKGTTIKELANTLEEYGIISDTTVFRVQAYVYNTKSKPVSIHLIHLRMQRNFLTRLKKDRRKQRVQSQQRLRQSLSLINKEF